VEELQKLIQLESGGNEGRSWERGLTCPRKISESRVLLSAETGEASCSYCVELATSSTSCVKVEESVVSV
jgi:hypothetical protein